MKTRFRFWLVCLAMTVIAFTGCKKAYYSTMEGLGHHKRDLLVDRVTDARDAQTEAREQFQTALEAFGSVVEFDGGTLEDTYKKLETEYERSESRAKAVSSRIEDVEDVSRALFREWENELDDYSSDELRRSSQRQLDQTRSRYDQLIDAMHRAESKMAPVLAAFKDQVLFLKHNLNARAVASLQNELVSVEAEVAALLAEMEASIAEADTFIQEMVQE